MEFRFQFVDRSAGLLREIPKFGRNAAHARELAAELEWPPRVISLRLIDGDGLEIETWARENLVSLDPKVV